MEIEVGEYVRLRDGEISIIENIQKNTFTCRFHKTRCVLFKDFIVKHSKNIIDLIEEGDYVNGKLIHKVDIRENSAYIYYGNCKTFADYQINSIVTKEMFASAEYRVETD